MQRLVQGLITRALTPILRQVMADLLESGLLTQMITSAIVGGMKESDVNTVGQSMIRMIMDPANNVEAPSDSAQVYDLVSTLGLPIDIPFIEEEPEFYGGI